MKLIVWLWNPWDRYAGTRHNIWAELLERYVDMHGGSFSFTAKYNAYLATIEINGIKVKCIFPQTYMNLSGESVWKVARFYNIEPDHIMVMHDEIDLINAKLQLRCGWGHAWHNGLKSIIAHIWSKDFWRLRVGVWRPTEKSEVSWYVLWTFMKTQRDAIEEKRTFVDEFTSRWIVGNV